MHTSKESADKPVLFLITDNYCTLEEDWRSKQSEDGGGLLSFVADILISNFSFGGLKRSLYCHLPTAEFVTRVLN